MMDKDELKRLIRETYPFPIAHAHKKVMGYLDDDVQKLCYIFQAAENAIQFAGLLTLAQARMDILNKTLPPGNFEKIITDKLRKNTSFGDWHDLSRELLKTYRGRIEGLVVPELFHFYYRDSLKKKKLPINPLQTRVIGPMITLRNAFHHNRLSESEIAASVHQGEDWLDRLMDAMQFLSSYQLSFIQRIVVDQGDDRKNRFTHDLIQVRGCFSTFDRERWQSAVNLKAGQVVFLHADEGRHLILNPFIIFADQIPVKGVPDIFMLNKVSNQNAIYMSTQFGAELTTRNTQWKAGPVQQKMLGDFFDAIRRLEPTDETVEIDWEKQVMPEDETSFSTTDVYTARYSPPKKTITHKSPYKFLDYFHPEDRDLFFGRSADIRALQQKFHNTRLLVLHGESGTGKTSLIRAGLIPRLPPESYVTVYVRTLRDPLAAIKTEIIRQLGRDARHATLPLSEFLKKETELLSKTIIMVLDQFEELFVRFPKEIRESFAEELGECIDTAHLDVKFLISLRAEYFSSLSEFEASIPDIYTFQMQLEHLTAEQAARAIVKPAETLGVKMDADMVQSKLLPDLMSARGIEPPLLQIVCDALYQNSLKTGLSEISRLDYEAIGDIKGVLSNYLNTKLRQFGKKQAQARAVIKALVTTENTINASVIDELIARLKTEGLSLSEEELKQDYLDKFVRDRLVRVSDVDGEPRYELSHDYLARHVGKWLDESERELKKILELIDRAHEAYLATGLLLEPNALEMIQPFEGQFFLENDRQKFLDESRKQARQKRKGLLLKVGVMLLLVALCVGSFFGYQTYQANVDLGKKNKEAEKNATEARNNLGHVFLEKSTNALNDKNFNAARLYAQYALNNFDDTQFKDQRKEALEIILSHPVYPLIGTLSMGHHDCDGEISISPDGKTLASGSKDHIIRLWDMETGNQIARLEGHRDRVRCLRFSPDNRTIASGSTDNVICLWDMNTQKQIGTLTGHHDAVTEVVFLPDGRTIVSASHDGTIRFWDVQRKKEKYRLIEPEKQSHPGKTKVNAVQCLSLSPDGKTLASGYQDGIIHLWDLETSGKTVLTGHENIICSLGFSPDGKTLASGSRSDVRIWDVEKKAQIDTLPGNGNPYFDLSFSPDGKLLAMHQVMQYPVAGSPTILDVETRQMVLRGETLLSSGRSLCFTPDGRTLAATDLLSKSIRFLDIEKKQWKKTDNNYSAIASGVVFSPDGRTLVSGLSDGSIRIWNINTGTAKALSAGHTNAVSSVMFSLSGRILAAGYSDETIRLWNMENGKQIDQLEGHEGGVRFIQFSQDEKRLASVSGDDTIHLWDLETKKDKKLPPQDKHLDIISLGVSGDGNFIAALKPEPFTLQPGGSVKIINLESGKIVSELAEYKYPVDAEMALFSTNGHTLAIVKGDNSIDLWDIKSEKITATLPGHEDSVLRTSFSPDGKTLATGSDRGVIRFWDVEKDHLAALITGHTQGVINVAFSPDGKTLVSGSIDGTLLLWNLEKEKRIQNIDKEGKENIRYLPEGNTLAATGYGGTYLWDLKTEKPWPYIDKEEFSLLYRFMTLSPDGKTIAYEPWDKYEDKNFLYIDDVESGKQIARLATGSIESEINGFFSPNSKILAFLTGLETVRLWDIDRGREVARLKGLFNSHGYFFSPDSKIIAYAASDNTVRLWDIPRGKEIAQFKEAEANFNHFVFSPDSKTLGFVAGSNDQIRLWDLSASKDLITLYSDEWINRIVFSPDSKSLAVGLSSGDIHLIDVTRGETAIILAGHKDEIKDLSYSPDGMMLSSLSDNQSIRLWHIESGEEMAQLNLNGEKLNTEIGMDFSPDGKTLVYGVDDDTLRFFDLSFIYEQRDRPSEDKYIASFERNLNLHLINVDLMPISPEPATNLYDSGDPPCPAWPTSHPLHWLESAEQGDARAMLELGTISERDHDLKMAEYWYHRAQNMGNKAAEKRSRIYSLLRAHQHFNDGESDSIYETTEDAIDHYSRAIDLNPNFWVAYWKRGNQHFQTGSLDLALSDFKKVTSLNPRHTGALGQLGWCLILQGKFQEAEAPCLKSFKLDSNNLASAVNAGHVYLLAGEAGKARGYYEKAVRLMTSEEELTQTAIADFELFIQYGWQVEACRNEIIWFKQAFALK